MTRYFIIQVKEDSAIELRVQAEAAKKDGYTVLWVSDSQCDGHGFAEIEDIREAPQKLVERYIENLFEEEQTQ